MPNARRLAHQAARSVVAGAVLATAVLAASGRPAPALSAMPRAADIAANDNTIAGGRLAGGVLHLDLVARHGMWYPDGPGTTGLPIEAFGEAGKPLQIPGPLVRVPVGTRVVATIHNELGHPLNVRGLAAPAEAASSVLRVQNAQTRTVSFVLDKAGAFGYYGSDNPGWNGNNPSQTIDTRVFRDAELSGAIVVEKPHAPRVDHVFVLGMYAPVRLTDGTPNFIYLLETINGRSFPATEHLTYERTKTVRWAVFNASSMNHPMHLHGFFYRIDRPNAYDEVTHAFRPGEAEELSWNADRAGNWMFHCHIMDHISRHMSIHDMLTHKPAPHDINDNTVAERFHLPNQPMGGMVIAVRVAPHPGDRAAVATTAPRRLSLLLDSHDEPHEPYPGLMKDTIALQDGAATTTSTGDLGPTIVLTQAQPVAIAVVNRTREQTSMHWHGIALDDSYYDGGSGMGMAMNGERMSPPIDPGATFVARFAPPDAGTFMYHAHMDDGWQLGSGLDGPLIVMPPGEKLDPSTDHVVMISESYEKAGSPFVAIGGSLAPAPLTMAVGVPQRLRLGLLTLGGQNFVVSLVDAGHVARWTPIAKDGRDLPGELRREAPASNAMTIGETRDFRFVPAHAGRLDLNVYDLDNGGLLVASQPIEVSTP